jgi:hypothetical protein
MMQSIKEHQEIPKGEAAGMPVGGPRKRRKVRNPAAERRQKRKERTRGDRGSRRKLAAACMAKKKHHQENSGPGKVWTAYGVRRRHNKDEPLCKSGMAQGTQS